MSAPRMRTPRRPRSATESLLSIALGLEAALVFFVTMAAFGLHLVPAAIALGGGAALFVILLLAGRMLRYRWGVWIGCLLQAVIILTGFVITEMFFIGAGFAAIWTYCFVTGRRLEARNTISNTAKESP